MQCHPHELAPSGRRPLEGRFNLSSRTKLIMPMISDYSSCWMNSLQSLVSRRLFQHILGWSPCFTSLDKPDDFRKKFFRVLGRKLNRLRALKVRHLRKHTQGSRQTPVACTRIAAQLLILCL
jgi:hypothetical protein